MDDRGKKEMFHTQLQRAPNISIITAEPVLQRTRLAPCGNDADFVRLMVGNGEAPRVAPSFLEYGGARNK